MSLTVQQLLTDAKRLSGRLRDHDASADNVISNAQEVLKAVDAMRQYQEDIDNLNSIAHNRPRAQLVLGIQQENRHIRQLQHENKELRAALEEHQNAIELIMSKYRQHITCLVHSSKLDKNAINQQKSRLLQDRADKICEMASIMNQSIQIDEERQAQDQELMSRLLTENKGLREMLEISSRNGSRTDPLIEPKVISRGCQTDESECSAQTAVSKSIPADEISNSPNSKLNTTHSEKNPHDFVINKEISKSVGTIDGRQQECLSATKDKSIGNSKASTSLPVTSYPSSTSLPIGTSNISTSAPPIAMNHSSTSSSTNTGLSISLSNETTAEECSSPSRPVSAASDSSESSTESSTTSEDDEDQEVAFNTIKRRQTKINVITPKSPSSSPPTNSNNTVASKISATLNVASNDTQNECDETKYIVNTNGDNACKMSAVNDCLTGDVNDNNKENGDDKDAENDVKVTKVNGDKNDVRTQSAITIDSVIKSDDKSSKKEQKSPKTANSMNALVNSFDEPTSLPGINLPARFKKANSKTKKSTIRKSDLRNCASDVDKKVSK